MSARFKCLLALVALLGCSCWPFSSQQGGRPTPTQSSSPAARSTCTTQRDTITSIKDQVRFHSSAATLRGCQEFGASAQVDVESSGEADGGFVGPATCRFSQLPAGTGPLKVAKVVARDPPGVIFQMADGQAVCSLVPTTFRLCGKATVLVTGVPLHVTQLSATCNSDPFVEVAVNAGGADILLDGSSSALPTKLIAGRSARVNLSSGAVVISQATFRPRELTLFQSQSRTLGIPRDDTPPILCSIKVTADPTIVYGKGTQSAVSVAISTCSPISGDAVSFTLTANPAGVCGSLKPDSGMTETSGQLKVTYIASGGMGNCTIKATESDTGQSDSVTILLNPIG